MQITINEANRKAKQLKIDYTRIRKEEDNTYTYAHSEGEKPIIQTYDFVKTQAQLKAINEQIAKIRHAVSLFNVTNKVQGMDITVDEALVRISMLSDIKKRLDAMLLIPDVRRDNNFHTVDIIHRNFNPDDVQAEANAVTDELNRLRAALDLTNLTSTIEVDL